MDNNIHIPLDLPDVRIVNVSKTEQGAWRIQVESTLNHTTCRKCGQPTSDFHGLDLSTGQKLAKRAEMRIS
jgi:transposase